ncbi:MAG TPA: LysR family transcriptional regulator [Caulobacteraceae bacterium]
MDLNLLSALDVLLAEQSVTAASIKLRLSPSAVSCALARLREALGDELLVLSGKTMTPTPYARALGPDVREILSRIDATLRSEPNFNPATSSRRFRIAASDFVTDVVLAAAIGAICRLAPAIEVDLLPLMTGTAFSELQKGDVDLIIAPGHYCDPANSQQLLLEDRFTCLAAADNASIGETISLEQFVRSDHVALSAHGAERTIDELFFMERGVERRVKVTAPTFALLPRLVVDSQRIATVPTRLAENYMRFLPLKTARAEFEMPVLTETFQWHRSRERDQALTWLRETIMAGAIGAI